MSNYIVPVQGVVSCDFDCHADPPRTRGTDYACPIGTDVHAIAGGVVTLVIGHDRTAGNYIEVDHGRFRSRYLHLSIMQVKVGEVVTRGQRIARSGNTGLSTGPHLHLDLGGPEADAKAVDAGAVYSPVANRWMVDFEKVLQSEPEDDDMAERFAGLNVLDTKRKYILTGEGKRYVDDTVELGLYEKFGVQWLDLYQAEADTIPDAK